MVGLRLETVVSRFLAAILVLGCLLLIAPPAHARSCTSAANASNFVAIHVSCASSAPARAAVPARRSPSPRPRNPGYLGNGACLTPLVRSCLNPLALVGAFLPQGVVGPVGIVLPGQPAAARPALPQIGGYQVLAAFRRIPLPAPRSVSQPGDKTLVNFDTIFYTRAQRFQRQLALLGRQITLDITPAQYTWHFGDGQSTTTDSAGGPYPDKSVVHRYPEAHTDVAHHVSVIWSARFRVDGGPWRAVPGNAVSDGPDTNLRIAEATPVLTGDY